MIERGGEEGGEDKASTVRDFRIVLPKIRNYWNDTVRKSRYLEAYIHRGLYIQVSRNTKVSQKISSSRDPE